MLKSERKPLCMTIKSYLPADTLIYLLPFIILYMTSFYAIEASFITI